MVRIKDFKPKNKVSKETINVIRTTQRNNVELTHIADNKANVLLSLNAIMLTFLLPSTVPNTASILELNLVIPLFIVACTCFSTIYISTLVLKPSKFDKPRYFGGKYKNHNPFFFGNIYKMEPNEFFETMDRTFEDKEAIKNALTQDMYYAGKRLGYKMTLIRRAFNIFLTGIFLSIVSSIIALMVS